MTEYTFASLSCLGTYRVCNKAQAIMGFTMGNRAHSNNLEVQRMSIWVYGDSWGRYMCTGCALAPYAHPPPACFRIVPRS